MKSETYKRYRQQGLCGRCGGEAVEGKTLCIACRDRHSEQQKSQLPKRREVVYSPASCKGWLARFKHGKGCAECGENHPATLQFHHRNPAEKFFNVGYRPKGTTLALLQAEVEKCDLLCANCHFKRHWNEIRTK